MKDSDAVAAFPLVAVAINRDKSSQNALKWATENVIEKGQTITLVHVNVQATASQHNDLSKGYKDAVDPQMKELFLPFRCFCTRKNIHCKDVVLEDTDVAKAIVEFVSQAAIEKLVVGTPTKGGFMRFKSADVASHVSKGAPDFCTVYLISKGKLLSTRNAVRAAPAMSPLRAQIQNQASFKPDTTEPHNFLGTKGDSTHKARNLHDESIKSPFTRKNREKSHADLLKVDTDISYVSSGKLRVNRTFQPKHSNASDGLDHHSYDSVRTPIRSVDLSSIGNEFSSASGASSSNSLSSQTMDDVETEIRRLRQELKQTMDMYSAACKDAVISKQKALELHRWKKEEEHKLEEARLAEETAMALVEKEKQKCKAAMEAAEAQQRIAELEAQKRRYAEMRAFKEAEERKAMHAFSPVRYRRYTIEEIEMATNDFDEILKIGEGGYGPVYKCFLDHTAVAVKVLRPDAAQGRTQFQQEVEILSCIRHPNMVLLLGACPEYGCLVYEYMANGSLDDRLFQRNKTRPIPWQHRFRIAAEIATGLLFLHQTKPEPLVHRDLKPGNILLDRNFVSKISDVGLARLVPPAVADTVTQYRVTSTAGTTCYIDPEYQHTGMLGVKSDVYSLGILLLQLITARPPMGITHQVSVALENGKFEGVLDQSVKNWPVEETVRFAQVALKCTQLRRKDRPDLGGVVLPELERLRSIGEDVLHNCVMRSSNCSPVNSQIGIQDVLSDPNLIQSGYDSSKTNSELSGGRRSNVSYG